ncbi:PH domain-containing protein [Methanosphaera sp.]
MMPKPKQHNMENDSNFRSNMSERTLLEVKPSMILHIDHFIFKIIVLFLLVFFFTPILAIFSNLQIQLLTSFQLNFTNMTFVVELILIFCIIIVLLRILLDVLDWNSTLYTLTESRIIIKRGIFRKEKIMMSYGKIQDIEVSQTILERLLNAGDVIIYGGHEHPETILDNIPDPKKVEEIVFNRLNGNSNHDYNQQYMPPQRNYEDYGGYTENNQQRTNRNKNVHYFNNEDYLEDEYSQSSYEQSNYEGYRNKWQKNKNNHKKSKMNDDEIVKKHHEMFRNHRK